MIHTDWLRCQFLRNGFLDYLNCTNDAHFYATSPIRAILRKTKAAM